MEDWLDFDYRQMPEVPNPMFGPMMPYQQMPMMPCQQMPMMPYQQPPVVSPLEAPPSPIPMPMPMPGTGTGTAAPDFQMQVGTPVQRDRNYLQGYLRTLIGKPVRVEFLIGTNILTDRVGTLVEVGIDHISLVPFNSNDLQISDLYSIKFVQVYGGADELPAGVKSQTVSMTR